jgi:fumarylacetoacetase
MELTNAGAEPFTIDNQARSFLEDGDEVTISGGCRREGFVTIGFGVCRDHVLPAQPI